MGIFSKKSKRKLETNIIQVPMPVLIRQVIYDSIFDDCEKIAAELGLPAISDDVSEMEEDASQDRLSKFSPLMPFIDAHSDISARVAAAAYALEIVGENPDDKAVVDEELEQIVGLFKIVALSSSISCISTLMNLDLLETHVRMTDE